MLDNLYDNIGEKIQNWAKWIFIILAIGSIIIGISMMAGAPDFDTFPFIMGIITIIVGPLVSYVSSWLLYAFGQLVEDISAIRRQNSQFKSTGQCSQPMYQPSTFKIAEETTQEAEYKMPKMPESSNISSNSAQFETNTIIDSALDCEIESKNNETSVYESTSKTVLTIPKEESSLMEKLEYSLKFQSDDGMIKYLQNIQDETVQGILRHPSHSIREQIKSLLQTQKQLYLQNKWDMWNDEHCSFGQCEVCNEKQQFLVYAEFSDNGKTNRKNLCFNCFSQKEPKPID